jgi:hypothetical protein
MNEASDHAACSTQHQIGAAIIALKTPEREDG